MLPLDKGTLSVISDFFYESGAIYDRENSNIQWLTVTFVVSIHFITFFVFIMIVLQLLKNLSNLNHEKHKLG